MMSLYAVLDMRPIGIPQTLRLSQYDSDFQILFRLENFDGAWTIDSGTTAEIQGTKTDGHGYSADCTFTEDTDGVLVTVAGDVQMIAAVGRNTFEIVLFHDGDRLGSKNFILDVERAALDAETTASDSKIKNFTEMVEAAEDAADTATAAAEEAVEAAARGGLSEEAKAALLACFRNVAWINDQGQDYYDALEDALADSSKTLTSISAVFDAGGNTIYTDDTLDSLKQYTTVTAHYSDGTSATVTAYTLTGTLTEGTSSLTATYESLTATVTVTNVVDFYNQYEWEYPSSILSKYIGNITYDENEGNIQSNQTVNYRATLNTDRGVKPIFLTDTGAYSNRYPIPLPDDVSKATITCDSTFWLSANIFTYDPSTSKYTKIQDAGSFGYGGGTKNIDSGSNRFITFVGGMSGNPDLSELNIPTFVTIQFE